MKKTIEPIVGERVIVPAPSGKISPEEAVIADEEFRRIEQEKGKITPKLIVDAARPKNSPLHHHFQWDDSVAAERWREVQARHLITSVYVIVKREDEETEPVRAYYSINTSTQEVEEDTEDDTSKLSGPNRGYVRSEVVAKHQGYNEQVIEYAKRQLRMWKKRFGAYKEFAKVVQEIDQLI